MSTAGGHRVALAGTITLSRSTTSLPAAVVSFDPARSATWTHPSPMPTAVTPQRWIAGRSPTANSPTCSPLTPQPGLPDGASAAGQGLVRIVHTAAMAGGEQQWEDERYRALLLAAPRSVWTAEAIATTVALVPGVRQVTVKDGWGGIDLSQSIFGDFTFVERLFAADRDLASPYFVSVLVAPTEAAIWDGQDGLRASVEAAIRDVRPVGVFPNVLEADQVYLGVQAAIVTNGLALPTGSVASTNTSPAALALKGRLLERLHRVVDGLRMSEPVRCAAVSAALMGEPGVTDVVQLRLARFPRMLDRVGSTMDADVTPEVLGPDENLVLSADQIAVLVDAPDLLTVR